MILPTTYVAALLLLILSFFCLGTWVNLFRSTGTRWRFELFYIDFAIGAILVSVIAAFTLGTLGSELAFSDRMLVAGRTSQACVFAAGLIFNLGNMLLLAAVSLIGMTAAFPLSVGLALVITSFFRFDAHNYVLLIAGIVLMIVALVVDRNACRFRDRTVAKSRAAAPKPAAVAGTAGASVTTSTVQPKAAKVASKTSPVKTRSRKTGKGLLIALLAGVALGLFYPVAQQGMSGDFGLGPYAGVLMFSIGMLISTFVYNFYFLNIAIDGGPVGFGAYFKGNAGQHFMGFGGGAMWAIGALAAALATAVPAQAGVQPALMVILPLASVLLIMFWGVIRWKEFAPAASDSKVSVGITALLFLVSLILLAIGMIL